MKTSSRPVAHNRRTDLRRAVITAVAAVSALGVVGCTTDPDGTAHPGADAPAAAPAGTALETLLLDDPDIARITDAPGLHVVDTYRAMPDPDGRTYSDPFCGGAISAASTTAYDSSSAGEVRGRRLADADADTPGSVLTRSADQAVIAFPDARAAQEFVAAARTGWAACAGVSVETRDDTGRAVWRMEQPLFGGGVLSVTGTHRSGWVTEHAIAAQGATVVDVAVSSADAVTGRAPRIVRAIADRLAQ